MSAPYDPIDAALAEDVGAGDLTCAFFTPESATGTARIVARQEGVLAGVDVAAAVFARLDTALACVVSRENGARLAKGAVVLEIAGSVRSILTGERAALNFIQRLSGIATMTRRFVDAIAGSGAVILDTRKTTPGLRALEKAAVVAGGGVNHRFGLFDMVMVKDNHLAAQNDPAWLRQQVAAFKQQHPGLRVELETDTLDQVREFTGIPGVDVILLDNMTTAQMREAVAIAAGRVKLEASGGVTLETVGDIARTGVDFVSVGALTHSAPSMDFSLELDHG